MSSRVHVLEHYEQAAVFEWAALNAGRYPPLALLFAVPNAGAGGQPGRAGWLKAEGVRRGVPDLCLPFAAGDWHGLFIELKRLAGGRTTPEQAAWLTALTAGGYRARVCHGAESAIAELEAYVRLGLGLREIS
jgi:hypothetical protein